MSFDAWVVSFGLSTLVRALHIIDGQAAYTIMVVVVAIDALLLYRFFSAGRAPDLTTVPESRPAVRAPRPDSPYLSSRG